MRVVITRAENEAAGMAEKVTALGCTPLIASMMEIEIKPNEFDPSRFQALVVTSANGIRSIAESVPERDMRIFCIGIPSRKAAEGLGFTNLESSIGNSKNLVNFIRRHADPADGPLLYVHGEHTAGNPAQELRSGGFEVRPIMGYRQAPIKAIPAEVRAEFESDTPPEIATFMSIRTFKLFREIMEAEGLLSKLSQTTAICISPAVADFARGVRWKKVRAARETTGAAVLDVVRELKEQEAAAT